MQNQDLTDELADLKWFALGEKYYHGKGVEKDYQKAAECYMRSAEMGFAPAQFSLGCSYLTGDGVKIGAGKGAEWLEKASAQGHGGAKSVLAGLKLGFIRSAIGIAGASDNDLAKDTALEAVRLVDELSSPTEHDKFNQREAYRYLGMLTASGHWKEAEALRQSKAYYEKGLPIHEATDTDAMYTYPIVLDNLGDVTGDVSYYAAAYEAASDIYQNAFDRLQDPDDKALILSFLVMERILGRFHPVDLDEAERLNNQIGTLGESNAEMFAHYRNVIAQKRQEMRPAPTAYSSPAVSSGSKKSGSKLKSLLGNLFR